MRRFGMALVLAVSLVAMAAPVASAAAPPARPYHGTSQITGIRPDAGLGCVSPVEWEFVSTFTYADFSLKDGRIREVGHQVEQDTFSANGKTLVGNPYKNNYTLVVSGDWQTYYSFVGSGTYLSVTLPDGTLIESSGRIDWMGLSVAWTPDNGHTGDIAAICDYFFG